MATKLDSLCRLAPSKSMNRTSNKGQSCQRKTLTGIIILNNCHQFKQAAFSPQDNLPKFKARCGACCARVSFENKGILRATETPSHHPQHTSADGSFIKKQHFPSLFSLSIAQTSYIVLYIHSLVFSDPVSIRPLVVFLPPSLSILSSPCCSICL